MWVNRFLALTIALLSAVFINGVSMAAQLPVPANLIPLDTPQGEQIFSQSQKSDYFWRLNLQFVSQDNLGYCSIASRHGFKCLKCYRSK